LNESEYRREPAVAIAVARQERIQVRVGAGRAALVQHRRIVGHVRADAANGVDAVARMRVHEDHAVGGRQSRERAAALDELARLLAEGHAPLGHGLVEGHRRAAAAVAQQHDLGDARLAAQVLDARLHVEGVVLPRRARSLVVVATRVHAEHVEAARRQLARADVAQVVGIAMHHDDADVRSRECSEVGLVEGALGGSGELHVERRRRRGECR
jgi:hypothetical protein